MRGELPSPLVSADVDVRDLDGFMLNVERLMASELVALSSHEVVAAALFLWCRAWKQLPAASLPNDDRVIAAFARMPGARFKKVRAEVLRGFVLCDDGRLYHRVLAAEAMAAYARKRAFQDRRTKESERIRQWRSKQQQNSDGTQDVTRYETHDERLGQGQGQYRDRDRDRDGTGTGPKEERKNAPPLRDAAKPDVSPAEPASVVSGPEADLFRRGKEILGASGGGMIRKLLTAKGGSVSLARAAIETATTKGDPREYLGAIIAGRERDSAALSARDRGDAW